ncbi:MAG TPA: hypothetical protein VG963_02250 [Polyangiaceae bacterium]|nr:hypothetical protein [Polyangiaceae bacterium]
MIHSRQCACAPRGARSPRAARYGLGVSLAFAALVPKCPMCLGVYLALFGIGGGVAALIHPFLLPVSLGLAAVALALLILPRLRVMGHRRPPQHALLTPATNSRSQR